MGVNVSLQTVAATSTLVAPYGRNDPLWQPHSRSADQRGLYSFTSPLARSNRRSNLPRKPLPRHKPAAAVAAAAKPERTTLPELPTETWRRILSYAWSAAIASPPDSGIIAPPQEFHSKAKVSRADLGLPDVELIVTASSTHHAGYGIDHAAVQKTQDDVWADVKPSYQPSSFRNKAYRRLALVQRTWRDIARELFAADLVIENAFALEQVDAQLSTDPSRGSHTHRLRMRVGVALPSQPLHPDKRAREFARVIGACSSTFTLLDVARLPSATTYGPLYLSAPSDAAPPFGRLETLILSDPPPYGDLKPLLDHMPRLRNLRLDLHNFATPDDRLVDVLASPPPPCEIHTLALTMHPHSTVRAAEMVHLLGCSERIENVALEMTGRPTAEHEMVPRAILSRFSSRVVSLVLAPDWLVMLNTEGPQWNAAAAAAMATGDLPPANIYPPALSEAPIDEHLPVATNDGLDVTATGVHTEV